jgi:hypothetical protein
MTKLQFIFLIAQWPFSFLFSQSEGFYKSYGGAENDYGLDVISSVGKTYTIAGATESFGNGAVDLYLLHLDSLGEYLWSKTFGGPNIEWGTGLVQTSDSGFAICGYTNSTSNGYSGYLVKTDKVGNKEWDKTYQYGTWSFYNSIMYTSDNQFVIVGEIYNSISGNTDGLVVKLNEFGDTLWSEIIGYSKNDRFNAVTETSDGYYILTGMSESLSEDLWVVKLTTSGEIVWDTVFGDTLRDEGFDIIETSDNRYLVTGMYGNQESYQEDHLVVKFNSDGSVFLNSYYNEPGVDYGVKGLQYKGQDNIISVGCTNSYGEGGFDFRCSYRNIYVGYLPDLAFNFNLGSNKNDILHSADTTSDGGIIMVGTSEGFGFGQNSILVYKKDSTTFLPTYQNHVYDLSVDENQLISISVFPNPCRDIVYFDSQILYNTDYQIIDIAGKLVLQGKLSNNNIEVSALPTGVYFIYLSEWQGVIKLFKQ